MKLEEVLSQPYDWRFWRAFHQWHHSLPRRGELYRQALALWHQFKDDEVRFRLELAKLESLDD